jgi:hypothetical protein
MDSDVLWTVMARNQKTASDISWEKGKVILLHAMEVLVVRGGIAPTRS